MPRIFNANRFEEKLSSLTRSKDSIQNISMWILHHKNYRTEIVKEWMKAFKNGDSSKRLTLFYVANDVLQHCKKKGVPEFREAFADVLEDIMVLASDEKIKDEIIRMIDIWNKRSVYSSDFLKKLRNYVEGSSNASQKIPDSQEKLSDVDSHAAANFRLKDFILSLRQFSESQKQLHNRWDAMVSLDDFEIPELSSLPSATHSQALRLAAQMETMSVSVQNCLKIAERDANRKQNIIKLLEESQVFYNIQNFEVEKVVHAYKIFGRKVKRLKKALNDRILILKNPNDAGTSLTASHIQVHQDSVKNENMKISSLDKRLLSMFQDSAILGSHLEACDEFASNSTVQDVENMECANEEMNIEKIPIENEPYKTVCIDDVPHNYACDQEVSDDNKDVKEEGENVHKKEIVELMSVGSIENSDECASFVPQSKENQVSGLSAQSHELQSMMSAVPCISELCNFVHTETDNYSSNVGNLQSPNIIKPFLSSPVKNNDSFLPLKQTVLDDSTSVIDNSNEEIKTYQNHCNTIKSTEVLKSDVRSNVELSKKCNPADFSFKLLLKSADILKNITTKSARLGSNSTILQAPKNSCTMPLNSLLNIIFHRTNISRIRSHSNLIGLDVNSSSNLCDKNENLASINNINELQSCLNLKKEENHPIFPDFSQQLKCEDDVHHKEHSEEMSCSVDSKILDNSGFENIITANIHYPEFQSNLLSSKSSESKSLVTETDTGSASYNVNVCNENVANEIVRKYISEEPRICDNLETNSIQTAPKGQNYAESQVHDKNLEIMDMDVDSSEDEALKSI